MELTLVELESLQEACRILRKAAQQVASGTITVWKLLDRAQHHLDTQMRDALAPEVF